MRAELFLSAEDAPSFAREPPTLYHDPQSPALERNQMTRAFRAKIFDTLRYRIGFFISPLKGRLMGLKMGSSVEIYSKVVIHDVSRVSIGNNTTIGAFTVLFGSGTITIGNDVLISTNCSIFSITHRTDALVQGKL